MTIEQIEGEAMRVVAALPEPMRVKLADVTFLFLEMPDEVTLSETEMDDPADLLGYYRGIPLTERTSDMTADLPDTIFLFRLGILREAQETQSDPSEVVRETILHEIAHFFGYDDDELEEMGVY